MKILIIGSRALPRKTLGRDYGPDVDIIGSYDDCMDWIKKHFNRIHSVIPVEGGKKVIATGDVRWNAPRIVEAEIAWEGSTAEELLNLEWARSEDWAVGRRVVGAAPSTILALKTSHRYLKNTPHFLKTMRDIRALRNVTTIPGYLEGWLARRTAETLDYGHPNLTLSKEQFFRGDQVNYVYDHDSIHEAVKHLEWPMYTAFATPGHPVKSSRERFEALPLGHRWLAVLEEAYVLALERSQIPHPGVLTPRASFDIAHEKICTSITSGWFREFAWENYFEVQAMYREDYMDKFQAALQGQKLVPYVG